jgi:cytochrome P450
MLELEPPRHTRLRGLVLRAFTSAGSRRWRPRSRRSATPSSTPSPRRGRPPPGLCPARAGHRDRAPPRRAGGDVGPAPRMVERDGRHVPGAPHPRDGGRRRPRGGRLRRLHARLRRSAAPRPADDLITHLIAAESEGEKLTTDELITTCILLLNAGHEATVHTMGNGVKALLEAGTPAAALAPDRIEATVEEILRFDPPLHLFTRHVYEEVEVFGHRFRRGDQVGCLLAAANRDPAVWPTPPASIPRVPCRRTSPSARASTSAWARRSPGSNSRSRCRCSSRACPACGWRKSRLCEPLSFPRAGATHRDRLTVTGAPCVPI